MSVYDTNQDALTRIADVRTIVDTATANADTFISELASMLDLSPPYITPGLAIYTPQPPEIDAAAPEHPTAVDGILQESQSDEPDPPDINTDLEIRDRSDELDDIEIPDATSFSFSEEAYESELRDAVVAKLTRRVDEGGRGLDESWESDAYNRDQERREEAAQAEIDAVADEFAGRGFTLPQGVLSSAISAIREKQRMDNNQRSADIRIKQIELAQQNDQFTITAAIQMEAMLIAHHDRVMDRALAYAKSTFDVAVAVLQARVALAEGKIRVEQAQVALHVDLQKLKLDVYTAKVAAYAKRLETVMQRARAYIDLYQADTAVYSATINKGEALARLAVSQSQISIENVRANIASALEASRANLQAFINTAQVKIGAIEGAARVYASEVAAALNSLSTIVQLASTGITTKAE